jgi:hypothetical protein
VGAVRAAASAREAEGWDSGSGGGPAARVCGGTTWMLSSGSVGIPAAVEAVVGAGAGGAAAALSAGFSTRKIPLHELQRTFTPPAGTLAESTGNDFEHDGHDTVMTMDRFGWVI